MKPQILKLIGKKIVDIRGSVPKFDKRCKYTNVQPEYILFDDGKTILRLEEQDYHSYHDCSTWARELNFSENKTLWQRIKKDKKLYPKATRDIGW